MTTLNRIVLIRHGETDGNSSLRFHGRGDVALSDEGRGQMAAARLRLPGASACDRVVSSPMRRAWESACIVAKGHAIELEPDFREIDFGRWEGLSAVEIEALDPILYTDWQARRDGFEFPDGERRAPFRARVERGLTRLLASGARSALVVAHKGVVRTIVEVLTQEALDAAHPTLGEVLQVTRAPDHTWKSGFHSSNPPALEQLA